MKTSPYRLASTREVYSNPWIRLREDHVRRPDGAPGVFGVVEMKPGATVLAINAAGDVHLVSEYKYAVGRYTLELVSGGIEAGETPLEAARRELREETGLEAGRWTDLGVVDPFTTVVASPNHLFLARDLSEVSSRPEPGEELRIERVPFPAALEMVRDGRITHAASCVLLLKAALGGL
jgi:8-oxo-dGTP pyrophosphatase MutT (NUDIX family)